MVELTGFTKIFAAFGVPGLVVGLVYWMLKAWDFKIARVPAAHAAGVVIVIVLVAGVLTHKLIDVVFPPEPDPAPGPVVERDLRFQTRYVDTKFYPIAGTDKVRADFTIRFVPTIKGNGHIATVFLGMAKFHDNAKVHDIDAFRRNDKKCEESPSCISPPVVWMGRQTVRGDADGVDHEFSAVLHPGVKHVLVYWEFFQREGDNGATCVADEKRPLDGLPFVYSVKDGKRIEDTCYSAWQQKVVPVTISL